VVGVAVGAEVVPAARVVGMLTPNDEQSELATLTVANTTISFQRFECSMRHRTYSPDQLHCICP